MKVTCDAEKDFKNQEKHAVSLTEAASIDCGMPP